MLFLPCTAPRPHHGDALAALPPHAEDKRSRAHASTCERSVSGAKIGAERTKKRSERDRSAERAWQNMVDRRTGSRVVRSRSKAMRVGSNLCRNRYERSHALSGEETGACFVIYLFIGVQRDQAPVVYRSSWWAISWCSWLLNFSCNCVYIANVVIASSISLIDVLLKNNEVCSN